MAASAAAVRRRERMAPIEIDDETLERGRKTPMDKYSYYTTKTRLDRAKASTERLGLRSLNAYLDEAVDLFEKALAEREAKKK